MAMDLAGSSRDMVFMRSAKVVPGRIYRATVYVRNAGSPPGGHMGLRIAWATKEKAWLDASYEKISSVVEDGSYTWKKLTAVAIAPDVKGCFMKILVSGGKLKSGQVFFDDFLLEEAVP